MENRYKQFIRMFNDKYESFVDEYELIFIVTKSIEKYEI